MLNKSLWLTGNLRIIDPNPAVIQGNCSIMSLLFFTFFLFLKLGKNVLFSAWLTHWVFTHVTVSISSMKITVARPEVEFALSTQEYYFYAKFLNFPCKIVKKYWNMTSTIFLLSNHLKIFLAHFYIFLFWFFNNNL